MDEQGDSDNSLLLSPSRTRFDDAVYCSISANSLRDVFIVYHKSFTSNTMCCRLGKFTEGYRLLFQEEEKLDHCEGKYPQVAINDDKNIVVVFTSQPFYSESIKYSIGLIQDDQNPFLWKTPKVICKGNNPSIAISGEKVLLVFSKSKEIFYKTGVLNNSSHDVTWGSETKVDSNACYPTVAMTENAFVVLYQDCSTYRLKTVVGEIRHDGSDPTYKLICGLPQDDSEGKAVKNRYIGCYPSVAMFDDCSIVATHQTGQAAFRKLFARSGKANTDMKIIKWHQTRADEITSGSLSSVAAVNSPEKAFVEAHSTCILGRTHTLV